MKRSSTGSSSRCALLLLIAITLSCPDEGHATSAVHLNNATQAAQSDAVVFATVEAVRSGVHPRWGRPLRLTRIRVDEVLRGRAPQSLEIEQFGGELDGRVTHVPGDAELVPGERCALFLRHREGTWFLTAMGQSKYQLVETASGLRLERDLDMALFLRAADGSLRPAPAPQRSLNLLEFRKSLVGPKGGTR